MVVVLGILVGVHIIEINLISNIRIIKAILSIVTCFYLIEVVLCFSRLLILAPTFGACTEEPFFSLLSVTWSVKRC
jgi:hypothetical protein